MTRWLTAAVAYWQSHHGLKVAVGLVALAAYHACNGDYAAALSAIMGALGLHFTVQGIQGTRQAQEAATLFTRDAYSQVKEGAD